jgi:hypothetical protein
LGTVGDFPHLKASRLSRGHILLHAGFPEPAKLRGDELAKPHISLFRCQ